MHAMILDLHHANLKDACPKKRYRSIRDGHIVSSKVKKTNGREGYERIYEYNDRYILLAGIGLNGFLVSAYPLKNGKVK